mmetsp:Transcript_16788/g.26029  ORF Transcript_16788/g.26029 Transcript_16788/m.26029 type:complete len:219 (-) Transcript_16788:57-713(-)
MGEPGTIDSTSAVRSLEQLYAQASGVRQPFLQKVMIWASLCSGRFPVDGNHGLQVNGHDARDQSSRARTIEYTRWDIIREDDLMTANVLWPKIKAFDRACEKTFRSYAGDMSRLVDICRAAIVFEKVHDLASCVRVLKEDPDIQVHRVKNRLDASYNARETAGYRDVCINLRVVTPFTMAWGLDTHVCELQLILMSIAQMKHEEGHKRYTEFRNKRAE